VSLNYSDEADVKDLLSDWHIEGMAEQEETLARKQHPGSWRWMILIRKPSGPT
jgi:hypothetical protein